MNLLGDEQLERSAVVANCRMNRERNLDGTNGYARELGFHPLEFLKARAANGAPVAWLDLCRGTGKALIEASRRARVERFSTRFEITGVDLVGMFAAPDAGLEGLKLVEASLRTWRPEGRFDLITCVHGLHYVGDKLGLIARAASWLADDGRFAANLDLTNLKVDARPAGRPFLANLRRAGLLYHRKRRLLECQGRTVLTFPYRYQGADDCAGPNSTGQPAVDSYYEAR